MPRKKRPRREEEHVPPPLTPAIFTTTEAAAEIGCAPATAWKKAAELNLGQLKGRIRLLSAADVATLRQVIRPGPGNPHMTAGNQLAAGGDPWKNRRKKKRRGKRSGKKA